MRLDKYLIKQGLSRKTVLKHLIDKNIIVNGVCASHRDMEVTPFDEITLNNEALESQQAYYLMMNKPAGILSATEDKQHKTAIDLINQPFAKRLHIAGRLDRASTGLLILTNDGNWSRKLTAPNEKFPKRYWVETVYSIGPDTATLFEQGILFTPEEITTSPARLELINETQCFLTIYEGRYHQIKRMFAAAGNRVNALHRVSMGEIVLDKNLKPGEYRALTQKEVLSLNSKIKPIPKR